MNDQQANWEMLLSSVARELQIESKMRLPPSRLDTVTNSKQTVKIECWLDVGLLERLWAKHNGVSYNPQKAEVGES